MVLSPKVIEQKSFPSLKLEIGVRRNANQICFAWTTILCDQTNQPTKWSLENSIGVCKSNKKNRKWNDEKWFTLSSHLVWSAIEFCLNHQNASVTDITIFSIVSIADFENVVWNVRVDKTINSIFWVHIVSENFIRIVLLPKKEKKNNGTSNFSP